VSGHPWAAWAQESAHETARLPGAPSRWPGQKDLSWVPLRPELVAAVASDHMENGQRFRHTTRFRLWRPDGPPRCCSYAQLELTADDRAGSGTHDHLDGAVLLALEHVVGVRRVGQRHVVGGEVVDAERVLVGEVGDDVVGPAADVGLAHAQLDLLVEQGEQRD